MAKTKKTVSYVTGRGWVTRTAPKKSAKKGACSFTVTGVRPGDTFYGETYSFPVSWRGRDAAVRFASRAGFRHAVLGMKCPAGSLTVASCNAGKCELLASKNPRNERKHRGKAAYSRPLAGW